MEVTDLERITRFIFSSRWFARTTRRVKPEAFIPHPYMKLSVSCTEGLKDDTVWRIGRETAAAHSQSPTLHGRADARAIRDQLLEIERDDIPLYHANIVGWEGERSAQISKAQEIAAASTLLFDGEASSSG
jgi:hypothetical protein